jgi:thiamine-phosphate pyrophosphorylase
MPSNEPGAQRRARLARARLYMVCPERGAASSEDPRELEQLVRAATAGGVQVVQVREKDLPDQRLAALASRLCEPCERAGALLIVNDRPDVALAAGADGVHLGQDDMSVAEARELVGPDMLIGLSTHAPAEVDAPAAAQADYIGVGPVHETPTKPGRPAVGIELVCYAAKNARRPFFAIGGLHTGNLTPVLEAGARRAVVLRAIGAASDTQAAARELRMLLDAYELDG